MNGEAAPGGANGTRAGDGRGNWVTLEPVDPGETTAQLWTYIKGEEQPGIALNGEALRVLIDALQERLTLIEENQ